MGRIMVLQHWLSGLRWRKRQLHSLWSLWSLQPLGLGGLLLLRLLSRVLERVLIVLPRLLRRWLWLYC